MISPRSFARGLFCSFLLLTGTSPAIGKPSPAPRSGDAELLETSANRIRFRVRFSAPVWQEWEGSGARVRYPVWLELAKVAGPNDPAIDAALVRVALPPRGRITLLESPENITRAAGVRFPTVTEARERAQSALRGQAPLHHARVVKIGVERGLRTALIAVYPVRKADDGSSDVFWAESMDVTVRVDGAGESRRNAVTLDPTSRALWQSSLLNPESVPLFVTSNTASASMPSVWFDDGAGWLKIRVAANGIYTLTRDALAQAGVPVSTLDPQTFRLFSGPLVPELAWTTLGWRDSVNTGDTTLVSRWYHVNERPGFTTGFGEPGGMEEIDLWVDGEGDGSFGSSDRVVFYGLGPDNYRDRFKLPAGAEEYFQNPYSDHTVYWLTWEGSFPGSPHRMATLDVTPSGSATITESAARVHAELNTIYAPSLYEGGLRWETWFWEILSSQSSFYRALVTLPAFVAGSTVSGRARLWGANQPEGAGDEDLHNVQVDVNSVSQGTFQWGGTSVYEDLSPKDIDFSNVNAASPTRVEFRVPSLIPGRLDLQYLAWVDVHYRRLLTLGSQPGELELDSGVAGRVVQIAQVPSGTLDVFDVTDFRHPRRLQGAVPVTGPGIELAVNDPAGAVMAVASRSTPSAPRSIELDEAPGAWLRETAEGLDHVVISHDAFLAEAERLAERRRASLPYVANPRASAVRVSDVMDEFAWGMRDPVALRYFLEYAYRYYGPGTARLSYAVFLGDHTYDFRNYLGTGNPDLVPSWEDNREDLGVIDSGSVQYPSDDPLVSFDGQDDLFMDVVIGRIPVSTVSAAHAVIEDKIVRSEEQPVYGSWRARAVIATDDRCQFGVEDPVWPDIFTTAEEVDQLLPPAFDRAKVYMTEYGNPFDCTITSKPQASDDFIALWNSGAWLVNYLGHGTETFLSDERLLSLGDIPSLTNIDRLPLFIATASKSAKFNLPNQTSITESVAISPTGGALAATGSASDQTYADVAFQLNKNFVSHLFASDLGCPACPPEPVPAGLAFQQAKGFAGLDTRKYVFFGDPAILPPAATLGNLEMSLASPVPLVRGGLANLGARLLVADPAASFDEWQLEIRAEDAKEARPAFGYLLPGDLMYRGTIGFAVDSVAAAFVVPLGAREGPDARIRGYAWTDGGDAVAAISPVGISGSVDPSQDTQGPTVTFEGHPPEMATGQTIGVVIEDPSGILIASSPQPALLLIVYDASETEVLRVPLTEEFDYDLGSYTRGIVRFPIPAGLQVGEYTFRVTASDNFGNVTTGGTAVRVTEGGSRVTFTSVYAYPNPLATETDVVFTLDRDVEVTLRIYSVSGRLVQKATVPGTPGQNGYHWDGRDQAGDPVANGVYLLQLSAPGQEDPVKHMERLVVLR